MRTSILLSLFLIFSSSSFCQPKNEYDAEDIKSLNEVAKKWELYWNNHNMDSFATLFAINVDFVTKSGTWFKGRESTIDHHKKNHETIFKDSKWITDSIIIKYVKPDLAIIHIGWGISGSLRNITTMKILQRIAIQFYKIISIPR